MWQKANKMLTNILLAKPWFWAVAHPADPVLCINWVLITVAHIWFHLGSLLHVMSLHPAFPDSLQQSQNKAEKKEVGLDLRYYTTHMTFRCPKLQALGRPDNLCSLTWTQQRPRGCSIFLYEKTQRHWETIAKSRMVSAVLIVLFSLHKNFNNWCIKSSTLTACTKQPVIFL